MLFILYVAMDNLTFTKAGITLRTWSNREKGEKCWYQLLTQIDLVYNPRFYVLCVRIPKRELTITVGEGKFKLNWLIDFFICIDRLINFKLTQ